VPLGAVPALSWCGEVSLEGILIIIDMDSHSHAVSSLLLNHRPQRDLAPGKAPRSV